MPDLSCLAALKAEAIDGIAWHEAPLVLLRINPDGGVIRGNPYAQQLTNCDFAGMALDQVFMNFSPRPVPMDVRAMAAAKSPIRLMLQIKEALPASLLFRFVATSPTKMLGHRLARYARSDELTAATDRAEQRAELRDSCRFEGFAIRDRTADSKASTHSGIGGRGDCQSGRRRSPKLRKSGRSSYAGLQPGGTDGESSYSAWHGRHPDGRPYAEAESPIQQTLTHGISHTADNDFFQRKDGDFLPVAFTSCPIIDHRKVVGAVVTFRDTTKRETDRSRSATLRQCLCQQLRRYHDHRYG